MVNAMNYKLGKNAQNLKAENRGLLFQHLATKHQTSRTELAQMSGLNKMTVSNIITEFIAQDFVVECSSNATRYNPITLELSHNAPKVIGLLIHRNRIAAALCNFNLNILSFVSENFETCTASDILRISKKLIDFLIGSNTDNIIGIGVGAIGPVDIKNGVILDPPYFYGITDVHIVDFLETTYKLPVMLNHHYNCEALAERYYGKGSSYQNYLFLGIEDGLGLGIILNGHLLSDFTGYESDFGYLCVNFDDHTERAGVPSGYLGAYVTMDRKNTAQFDAEISTLSFALSGICNILYPQAIIIGDPHGMLTPEHLATMKQQINNLTLSKNYREIEVCCANSTNNFDVASCAISIIQQVFSGQILFQTEEHDTLSST